VNVDAMPTFIGKRFDQVAFVVEDLATAQDFFRQAFGIGPWSVWNDMARGQAFKTYRGEPEDFQFSCAYGFSGDVMIELCHHDGGRSIYKDWLDTRGGGLHHIGFRVADAEEFETAKVLMAERGNELAMGGGRESGVAAYAYFDTVEEIGCYTEIYFVAPQLLEVFDRMRRGEIVDRPKL
jgi:catechol 2,3-dioxygenase-like lactoylglutathione lyase family enzyme